MDGTWMVCGWYMDGTWMVCGWYVFEQICNISSYFIFVIATSYPLAVYYWSSVTWCAAVVRKPTLGINKTGMYFLCNILEDWC
jgi:hypothetical protein